MTTRYSETYPHHSLMILFAFAYTALANQYWPAHSPQRLFLKPTDVNPVALQEAHHNAKVSLVLFLVMVENKVGPAVPAPNRNVAWCFKPLFFWMRIFGIELYDKCFKFRKAINLYGLLVLLTCLWASIDFIAIKFWKISSPLIDTTTALNMSTSTTLSWNARIDAANHFCFITIVYPAFFYVAQNRWLRLWNVMETFDFAYCKIDHSKLRRTLLVGFFPIVAVKNVIHNYT